MTARTAGGARETADLLGALTAAARRTVRSRALRVPLSVLEQRAREQAPRRRALTAALAQPGGVNVIAECKRRSPVKGVLCPVYDPATIARAYEAAGAAAISVLTEPTFFDGAVEHLQAVREAVDRPVLRKDFVVEEYQIVEARAFGADGLLVIVAALEDRALRRLLARIADAGMAALVEVHDEVELARALDAGTEIIGVNNRSLRNQRVDLRVSLDLASSIPEAVVRVAESGIRTAGDVSVLRDAGYQAFLIGESLVTRPDPGEALRSLLAECGEAEP